MSLIKKEDAVLAVIDLQTKLLPAMANPEPLQETVVKLIKGIRVLGVPVLVTQQYTKGLGPTVPTVAEVLGSFSPIEKMTFSAMGEPDFARALAETNRKTVILIGIETHICVQQTALQMAEDGYNVYIIRDCVASRKEEDNLCSQQRMAAAGIVVTTYESVLYELMRGAKADGFKAISAIVK